MSPPIDVCFVETLLLALAVDFVQDLVVQRKQTENKRGGGRAGGLLSLV